MSRRYTWAVGTVQFSLEHRSVGPVTYKIGRGAKLLHRVETTRDHAAQLLRSARKMGVEVRS